MLLFAWTSFSWSITFVAVIDPWFSFFRIAWVSWTFWLSLLACKKVCIIAFLSRAVSNLPPFGEIVSHFRAYLTLYLERPIKCVVFICPQISVRFLLKTSIFTLIFLIRLSKISFARFSVLVGLDGLEPSTSRLSGARSNHLSYRPLFTHGYSVRPSCRLFAGGGDEGNRTLDPLLAGQVLSQLSYTPILGFFHWSLTIE